MCMDVLSDINKIEHTSSLNCNMCDSQKIIVISQKDRYGINLRSGICSNCGLVFLIDRLTKSGYWDFYSSGLYRRLISTFHEKVVNNESIHNMQKVFAHNLISTFHEKFEYLNGGTMLDIGGSSGNISKIIKEKYNYKLSILDPAGEELNYKVSNDVELIHSFIEDFDYGNKKYDVILLYQTIDHLYDLRKSLIKIQDMLADEGIFIFDILDFSFCCNYGPADHFLKIDHCYYLSREIVENMLKPFGFEVIITEVNGNPFHTTFLCKKSRMTPTGIISEMDSFYFTELILKIRKWYQDKPIYSFPEKVRLKLYRTMKNLKIIR